jgi:hypothetical protein
MTAPARRPWFPSVLAALTALAALALAAVIASQVTRRPIASPPRPLRIAGGPEGGSYLPIARALAGAVNAGLAGVSASAVVTEGGPDNVQRLEARTAELALVENNVTPGGRRIFAVAPLYQEFLHVVVREGVAVARADDLRGKRIGIGPALSGTDVVARIMLAHYDIGPADAVMRSLSHLDAAAAMDRGELDVACVLTGLKAPVVSRLLAPPGRRLLSLGDAAHPGSALQGLRLDAPFLDAVVVPERVYGDDPPAPVGTIGVRAILCARHDLEEDLVREVTRAIFESKVGLGEREKLLARISERFDPADVRFPLHAGAVSYFHREDPPLIVVWADAVSLIVSLLVLAGSGALAAWGFVRRRRKNRIDAYYDEVQTAATLITDAAALGDLQGAKEMLHRIRRRAFDDLVAERLDADESFTIFQDYVRSEMGEVEGLIRRREEEARRAAPQDPPRRGDQRES